MSARDRAVARFIRDVVSCRTQLDEPDRLLIEAATGAEFHRRGKRESAGKLLIDLKLTRDVMNDGQ